MPISTISTDIPAQTGVNTRLMRVVCTDDLATITTAGYLNINNLEGYTVVPYDFFHIYYGSDSSSFGVFSVSVDPDTGVVTLNETALPADAVTLSGASVVGNMPKFSNTSGQVVDSGAKILSGISSTFGGGGTSFTFTVTGITSSSVAVCDIVTATNSVPIDKVLVSTNTITITFGSDPGAATTIKYIATTAPLA